MYSLCAMQNCVPGCLNSMYVGLIPLLDLYILSIS